MRNEGFFQIRKQLGEKNDLNMFVMIIYMLCYVIESVGVILLPLIPNNLHPKIMFQ